MGAVLDGLADSVSGRVPMLTDVVCVCELPTASRAVTVAV